MPARIDSNRSQTNLQAVTIEYVTTGPFDGRTVAPAISPDNTSPDPADGIYRMVLAPGEAIGLIDLSFCGIDSGGMGDRYVSTATGGAVGGTGSFSAGALGVSDNVFVSLGLESDPLLIQTVQILNGAIFYEKSCILVPQGCFLSISGLPSAAGGVNVLRITIDAPQTPWHGALLEESCCCDAPDVICPIINSISPSSVEEPVVGFVSISIAGSNFYQGIEISGTRIDPDDGAPASFQNLEVVDQGTATAELVTAPPGLYEISLFDPNNPECSGVGQLTVTPAP